MDFLAEEGNQEARNKTNSRHRYKNTGAPRKRKKQNKTKQQKKKKKKKKTDVSENSQSGRKVSSLCKKIRDHHKGEVVNKPGTGRGGNGPCFCLKEITQHSHLFSLV